MGNRTNNPEGEDWSEMGPHYKFLEMCAISTSGDLTEEEEKDLQAHLAECPDCRQALNEFEAAADIGVPLLHSQLGGPSSLEPHSIPIEVSKAAHARATLQIDTACKEREPTAPTRKLTFPNRNANPHIQR